MCLAKIYKNTKDGELITDSVTALEQKNGSLVITNLFGDLETISGKIISIDFTDSVVIVEN